MTKDIGHLFTFCHLHIFFNEVFSYSPNFSLILFLLTQLIVLIKALVFLSGSNFIFELQRFITNPGYICFIHYDFIFPIFMHVYMCTVYCDYLHPHYSLLISSHFSSSSSSYQLIYILPWCSFLFLFVCYCCLFCIGVSGKWCVLTSAVAEDRLSQHSFPLYFQSPYILFNVVSGF